ncbi:hypothetical protein DICA0_F11496 [Diutina catenulata]
MASNVHKRSATVSMDNELNLNQVSSGGSLPVAHQDTFTPRKNTHKPESLAAIDRPAFFVLVVLYLLQGVPVGLAFGSIPFILKSKLSYAQVGVFSLAAYPYSLKLLWSPIVDSIYSKKWGRRKSWIMPVQAVSGVTLLYLGTMINSLLEDPKAHLMQITATFFLLVFFCATQDIAVDGWALTVLSPESLSYASTAQTVGINSGYFMSFTIFLALSSPDFANKYMRKVPLDQGLFTLGSYLQFWGWAYLAVTAVLYFVPEDPAHLARINEARLENEKAKTEGVYNKKAGVAATWNSLKGVYATMFKVLRLPNVQTFVVILLLAKLGFQANESATNLKLLEKGLSKEDLSITVLVDFPFEMLFGYYAARWSQGKSPLKPWLFGFVGRLVAAVFAQIVVYFFPTGEVSKAYFGLVIAQHLLSSFMSTIQFVSLCAFHTKIADPTIGGTYMTTLNTLSNYGGTWPKIVVLWLIDKLTVSHCQPVTGTPYDISSEDLRNRCKESGGVEVFTRDGYYYTNVLCICAGVVILIWVKRKLVHLQSLPISSWRVTQD